MGKRCPTQRMQLSKDEGLGVVTNPLLKNVYVLVVTIASWRGFEPKDLLHDLNDLQCQWQDFCSPGSMVVSGSPKRL